MLIPTVAPTAPGTLNRRTFLSVTASAVGGLLVSAYFDFPSAAQTTQSPAAVKYPPSAFVHIRPDGKIVIQVNRLEFGQGANTGLPMLTAEEMDADWNKVTLDWAPSTPEVYGWPDRSGRRVMTVTGSRAVMMYWNDLRTAGAQVRKVLIANAADHWGVDAATLKTEPSAVVDPKSGKRLSYGEIAAFGITEASAGSDSSNVKTRARRDGEPVVQRAAFVGLEMTEADPTKLRRVDNRGNALER